MKSPAQATPEIRLPLSVTTRTPTPGRAAQDWLSCSCWVVLSNDLAPKLKRGQAVLLSADVEPHPGDIVAVSVPDEPGFTLVWYEQGQEVLSVVVAVYTSYCGGFDREDRT